MALTNVAARLLPPLAALDHNPVDGTERLDHLFRLLDMDEPDRSRDDTGRPSLAAPDAPAKLHQSGRSVAENIKGIGMLLRGQSDTGLRTGDTLALGRSCDARVV